MVTIVTAVTDNDIGNINQPAWKAAKYGNGVAVSVGVYAK